ncbi:hypothetical protein JXA48_00030 [Candidatus Woesearchaeota archaeon]|nr:hypothetical protein [Candidatus Woesearchaeota archaeon]
MSIQGSIEAQVNEIEIRLKSIVDRIKLDDPRRGLVIEFGEDLVEKAKQGISHYKKLKKNNKLFTISRSLHPKNGQKPLTQTLDSYEALSSKIKGISDNLGSLLNAIYLDDKSINIQLQKFDTGKHIRNISTKSLHQVKSLPQITNPHNNYSERELVVGLEDTLNEQFEKCLPFFSHHRNSTQHAKTKQHLNIQGRKITLPQNTIYENSPEIKLVDGLEDILTNYMELTHNIIRTVSQDNIKNLESPDSNLEKKVTKKLNFIDIKDGIKKGIFTLGVISMIGALTYALFELISKNDKMNSANKVITSMYEAQDNKKTISITNLINEQNTEDINNKYTKVVKQNLWRVDPELGNIYGNTSRKTLDFFVGKEHQEYVNIIKQIKATEDFAVDSIRRYLIANHQGHAIAGKFLSEIIKYGESMHDSLDNLVRKKLAMDRSTIAFQTEVSDLSNDPIIYSLQQAVMFAKKELRRDFWQLTTDEAYELFLDPKIVIKLNENFDEGMKEICDSLEISRSNKRIYEFLTNNTMYLTLLSKNQTDLDEVEKDIREELSNNIHLVGSSMVKHNGEKPYDVYANIVWSRKFSQRPLRALKMPYIYDKIDTVFTEYHNTESRPEFEVFLKEVKEGTYLHKDLRLN